MAFFEELGRKAKDVAAVVLRNRYPVSTCLRVIDEIPVKFQNRNVLFRLKVNAGEQREIEKNCRLIGEWFINEYEGELPEGVQELADAVAASKARIAELEEQKNAIKVEHSEVSAAEPGMKICPVCGAESDSKFCPKCGAPMD